MSEKAHSKRLTRSFRFAHQRPARQKRLRSALVFCIGLASVGFAVWAFNRPASATRLAKAPVLPRPAAAAPSSPGAVTSRGAFFSRLALQPEADRFRRRIGQRFVAPGREMAVLAGSLTIAGVTQPIRLVRQQTEEGESLAMALAGHAALTWTAADGARTAGILASGAERALIERLALDSPDQFVLAQLRGVSYFTVARSVMPAAANGSEIYAGPLWDLVRLGEPPTGAANPPLSASRLFYINSATGLLDKVVSEEQGETIVAEFSNWVSQNGEAVPAHITWKQNEQILMELTINTIAHGPLQ